MRHQAVIAGWNYIGKRFQLLKIGGVYHVSAPDGTVIAPTDVMTYLGTAIYADGSARKELSRKLGTAWSDFSKLSRLWKHTSRTRSFKIKVYKSV